LHINQPSSTSALVSSIIELHPLLRADTLLSNILHDSGDKRYLANDVFQSSSSQHITNLLSQSISLVSIPSEQFSGSQINLNEVVNITAEDYAHKLLSSLSSSSSPTSSSASSSASSLHVNQPSALPTQNQETTRNFIFPRLPRSANWRYEKLDIFALGATIYELAHCKALPESGAEWHALRCTSSSSNISSSGSSSGSSDGSSNSSSSGGGLVQGHLSVTLYSLLQLMMHENPLMRPSAEELVFMFKSLQNQRNALQNTHANTNANTNATGNGNGNGPMSLTNTDSENSSLKQQMNMLHIQLQQAHLQIAHLERMLMQQSK
jgi:hypothetical protein